jgi:hypothetical protein
MSRYRIADPNRARSSAEEHYLDMVGVTGSIPVAPTTKPLANSALSIRWAVRPDASPCVNKPRTVPKCPADLGNRWALSSHIVPTPAASPIAGSLARPAPAQNREQGFQPVTIPTAQTEIQRLAATVRRRPRPNTSRAAPRAVPTEGQCNNRTARSGKRTAHHRK